MPEFTPDSHITEHYWELLKNLEAPVKLALIERLAHSLRGGASLFNSNGAATSDSSGNNADTNIFWWDALEE